MREKSLPLVIILLLAGVFWLAPESVHCIQFEGGGARPIGPESAPGRLIVKLKPEAERGIRLSKLRGQVITGLAQLDSLNLKFSVSKQERLFGQFELAVINSEELSGVYVLEVPTGTDLRQMKAEYESRPEVDYVELDYKVQLFETPDDPLFPHQWFLDNLGAAQNGGQGYYGTDREQGHQLVMKFGTQDADIDALEAFQRNDEMTIPLVGIIDTGVDLYHEDLRDNVWTNPGEIPDNGIDDDHNGFVDDLYGWDFSGDSVQILEDNDPTDTYGHGTHCAGVVAAVRDNSTGVSGINGQCKILALKFFPYAYMSLAARSIVYAADMGCDVINMSWGSPQPSKLIKGAIDYAIGRGTLPVAAAGNDNTEKRNYPAAYEGVFTVGASNSDDEVTPFSTYGDHINVVAPGRDILSLRAEGTDMYAEDGFPYRHIVDDKYYLADGTSMASPCAAGVAAHLLAASPGMSVQRLSEIMELSADDITHPYGGDSLYSPGRDIYSGYGRVNLNSALQLLSGRMAKIDYPAENALVSGEVALLGTAAGPNFENYLLEYGEGLSPLDWTVIKSSDAAVMGDTLGIWNSEGLTGLFTLRLTVGDENRATVHVIANNHAYVKITSPDQGDTIAGLAEIRGYTLVPGFSHYILEYGYGESPAYWIRITSSTKMVADGLLGNWLVSFLNVTDYSLRLSVKTDGGEVYADTVGVLVKSIASGGWVRELAFNGSLSPAVGDIDGDGYDEIVVGVGSSAAAGRAGGVEVFAHDGRREAGWPKDTDRNMMSSPALGDLDEDGIADVVICSDQGIHAYRSNFPDWFRTAATAGNSFWGLATPVIADLEGDGHLEVLTHGLSGGVYAWREDGTPVISGSDGSFGQTAGSTQDMDFPSVVVADLDADGQNEVIAGAAHPISGEFGDYLGVGGIYIWSPDGDLLLQPGDYPFQFVYLFGIAVANIDDDEDLEIIALGSNANRYALCALKKDGSQIAGYPIIVEDLISGWWFASHPAVGDIDGDGTIEIVVSVWTLDEARIYAWHQDGTPVVPQGPLVCLKGPDGEKNREILSSLGNSIGEIAARCQAMGRDELTSLGAVLEEQPFASEGGTFGSPVLADVNGDGEVDVVVRSGNFLSSGYERICAWDYEGNAIPGFPLYASSEMNLATYYPYTPVLGDTDKDGKLNLIVGTDYNIYARPRVISWELEADWDPAFGVWPKYMHDQWNSGRHGFNPPTLGTANVPPAGFHVKSWTDTSVTLGWCPRAPWINSGYNIYRATVSGEVGERVNAELIPQPDSQYQDVGLSAGQRYYYTITGVDHHSEESAASPEIGITPGGPLAPVQPLANLEQGVVTLIWPSNPAEQNVVEYLVHHQSPSCGEYHVLGSAGPETTYVDSSIKEVGAHLYRVSAVNSMGLESYPSAALQVEIEQIGSSPHRVEVSSWLGGNATLSWRVTQGGQGCYLYRSLIPGVYSDPPLNAAPIDDPFGHDISYQDWGLTEGINYHYVVTQIQGGITTSPSEPAEFLAGRPQAVVNVTGEVRDCHIVVHWNPSSEGDVVRYKIYDGTGHGGDIALVDSVEGDTIYVDPAADDSLKHYFWITAADSMGLESHLPFHLEAEPGRVTGPLYPPEPPSEFKITDHSDTSITFKLSSAYAHPFNIYLSTVSAHYDEPPINPDPIPNVFPQQFVYRAADLFEGQSYFFNATAVKENQCGTAESAMNPSLEATFVPGRPGQVTGLSAELDQECRIVLSWQASEEGDIVKYRIYREQAGAEPGFGVIDSVSVSLTTYADTDLVYEEGYRYGVAAVDSLGLEGLRQTTGWIGVSAPAMPEWLEVTEITDTSVALEWYRLSWTQNVVGANVYRSLVSGHYLGLNPVNDTLIAYDDKKWATYTDFEVQEGMTYYYTVTNVNVCGLESPRYCYPEPPNYHPLEDTAVAGTPHRPDLEVKSGRENIQLHMTSSNTDIKGYKIFRREYDGEFQVVEWLYPGTLYTDSRVTAGVDYLYKAAAIDTFDLQSLPTYEIEGCLMPFDLGTILVDLTRGTDSFHGVKGDSVDAFYQRALAGRDYAYIDRSQGIQLRLIDLSRHGVAIVHMEDEPSVFHHVYPLLKQYLEAGGALLLEGRRILLSYDRFWEEEFKRFLPGDFRRDYLNIDSAFVPAPWSASIRGEEFIGAERASGMTAYPDKAELDTFRVNHAYAPLLHDFEGKVPGVGYFWPAAPSEVIYTFRSAYDTSASNGKPVALRHFTRDVAVIYFGFPLYFVREEIATEILHMAVEDLFRFANRSTPYYGFADDLVAASVYPNPFKPYQGHTQVTFDGLTALARIEIFTITGEKVCTLEETDGDGELSWDVTNAHGKKLASGIYIYRITNNQGQEKISKLAVIR